VSAIFICLLYFAACTDVNGTVVYGLIVLMCRYSLTYCQISSPRPDIIA